MTDSAPLQPLKVEHAQIFQLMLRGIATYCTAVTESGFTIRVCQKPARDGKAAQRRTVCEFACRETRNKSIGHRFMSYFSNHRARCLNHLVVSNCSRVEHQSLALGVCEIFWREFTVFLPAKMSAETSFRFLGIAVFFNLPAIRHSSRATQTWTTGRSRRNTRMIGIFQFFGGVAGMA